MLATGGGFAGGVLIGCFDVLVLGFNHLGMGI